MTRDFAKEHGHEAADLTVLGLDAEGKPSGYWQHDRAGHTLVVGATGSGKQTLLESIVLQDIAAGRGGLFIDPHGEASERIHDAVGEKEDIRFLSVADGGFRLRLLDVEDASSGESRQAAVEVALGLLAGATDLGEFSRGPQGPRKTVRRCLDSLAWMPEEERGNDAEHVVAMLSDRAFRERVLSHVRDQGLLRWWYGTFETRPLGEAIRQADLISSRLAPVLKSPTLAALLGDGAEELDLRATMDAGGYLVLSLDSPRTSAVARYLAATTVLHAALLAGLSRQGHPRGPHLPEAERRRFHLVLDEFPRYAGSDLSTFLEEARAYGLSLTLSCESLGQLEGLPFLRKSIETTVANRIVLAAVPDDAKALEPFMAPMAAADLVSLPRFQAAVKTQLDFDRKVPARMLRIYPPGRTPDTATVAEALDLEADG